MESRCSIPVQVLSFCGTDGRIQPIRFRLEDEAHQLQTVAVRQEMCIRDRRTAV